MEHIGHGLRLRVGHAGLTAQPGEARHLVDDLGTYPEASELAVVVAAWDMATGVVSPAAPAGAAVHALGSSGMASTASRPGTLAATRVPGAERVRPVLVSRAALTATSGIPLWGGRTEEHARERAHGEDRQRREHEHEALDEVDAHGELRQDVTRRPGRPRGATPGLLTGRPGRRRGSQ